MNQPEPVPEPSAQELEAIRVQGVLESLRAEYADAPERFIREVLGVQVLWSGQHQMISAVQTSDRVACVGANATGKTFAASALMVWRLYTDPVPPTILVLSPIARQQSGQFWREARQMVERAGLPGRVYEVLDRGIEVSRSHRMFGFATKAGAGPAEGRALGYHAENLIVFVDQAESIEPWLWDAIFRLKPARILAAGNGREPTGLWHALFDDDSTWTTLKLSALDLVDEGVVIPGGADRAWVDEQARMYGADSAAYAVNVRGEFAWGWQENVLIPVAFWQQADELWRSHKMEGESRHFRPVVGWDVATTVGMNAVAGVQGPLFLGLATWQEPSLQASCTKLVDLVRPWGLRREWVDGRSEWGAPGFEQNFVLVVDATGVGYGAAEFARRMRLRVVPFVAASAPERRDQGFGGFSNKRTEAAWSLRHLLEQGRLAVPWTEELVRQGTVRWYSDPVTGLVRLERKRELSGRVGIKSPDELDALSMAAWYAHTKHPMAV